MNMRNALSLVAIWDGDMKYAAEETISDGLGINVVMKAIEI